MHVPGEVDGGGAYRQITVLVSQAMESSCFGTSVPWAFPEKNINKKEY